MTEIEELLRHDGQQWRSRRQIDDASPPSVNVQVALRRAGRRRRASRTRLIIGCTATVVLVVTLALALDALRGDGRSSGTSGALPTAPVSTDALVPVKPPLPVHPADTPFGRILGPSTPGKLISMPWELVRVGSGGQVLTIFYVAGDGYGIKNVGFRVIETHESVEVVAVSRNTSPGQEEPGSLARAAARIRLSQPLGSRALLHGPTDWPASYLSH